VLTLSALSLKFTAVARRSLVIMVSPMVSFGALAHALGGVITGILNFPNGHFGKLVTYVLTSLGQALDGSIASVNGTAGDGDGVKDSIVTVNTSIQQEMITMIMMIIGCLYFMKALRFIWVQIFRFFDFIFDHVLWQLYSLPVIGRFCWRRQWSSVRFLTVGGTDPVMSSIKTIKIKISDTDLLTVSHPLNDKIEIFAETADAQGVIGGPGHRFKLTKEFINGPPPAWPSVGFTAINRID
jgi:hypothetical protein